MPGIAISEQIYLNPISLLKILWNCSKTSPTNYHNDQWTAQRSTSLQSCTHTLLMKPLLLQPASLRLTCLWDHGLFIWCPLGFPESCFWPKPWYFPSPAEGETGVSITISLTGTTRMEVLLSPRQTLASTTLGAGAPRPGTADPPCSARPGGWREAGALPAHFPCFYLTESFPLQSGHSPAVLSALELHFQFRESLFYRNSALQQLLCSVCFVLT